MPTIVTAYGTRPEAIKMAPIVSALRSSPQFKQVVVVTGQHRHMLDQVNSLFDIEPDYDLDLFRPGQQLGELTERTLSKLGPALAEIRPDAVLVQGDTTSAFASALAAFYQRIPVFHIEAGLRTDTIWNPYPEEMNRRLITQLASLNFAPTAGTAQNLRESGAASSSIVQTGNTVIDALLHVLEQNYTPPEFLSEIFESEQDVVVVTAHRRESWGEPMQRIGAAVARLAQQEPSVRFVLPLHGNPLVRDALVPSLAGLPNVLMTDPLPYADFAQLLNRAKLVLSDSGGVQEEAPSLGKPVLVLRDNTERPEAVAAGTARLVGTDIDRIVTQVRRLLNDSESYERMAQAVNPYGDGLAASRSVAAMSAFFDIGERLPDFVPSSEAPSEFAKHQGDA